MVDICSHIKLLFAEAHYSTARCNVICGPSHLGFQFVMPTQDSVISFTVHVFGDTCRSISVELILQVKE